MHHDPIVEEIRAIKHKLAAECDNDVAKIFAQAREQQAKDGRKYVTLSPRPVSKNLIPLMDAVTENQPQQPVE